MQIRFILLLQADFLSIKRKLVVYQVMCGSISVGMTNYRIKMKLIHRLKDDIGGLRKLCQNYNIEEF